MTESPNLSRAKRVVRDPADSHWNLNTELHRAIRSSCVPHRHPGCKQAVDYLFKSLLRVVSQERFNLRNGRWQPGKINCTRRSHFSRGGFFCRNHSLESESFFTSIDPTRFSPRLIHSKEHPLISAKASKTNEYRRAPLLSGDQ